MILVDTSVWVDHLRKTESKLSEHLDTGDVLMHPMIIGEIACGNLPSRTETLKNLNALPRIDAQDDQKVLSLVDSQLLMGRGIGYIDAHLICSVLNRQGTSLWTRDRRLKQVAEELGVAYPEQHF